MEDKHESQSWFWTEEWQAGERAAEAELKAGRFIEYAGGAEFMASL